MTEATTHIERRYVYGPGVDEPLVWYEGSDLSDPRYLVADERGSIVAVTDGAGAALSLNSYDEYGNPAATTPAYRGRFGYTGQAWLPTLGMWYYKARMYSPTLGRFMQTDPIGFSGGMHLYDYVGSDPINWADPLGLDCISNLSCDGPEVVVPGSSPLRGGGGGGSGTDPRCGSGFFDSITFVDCSITAPGEERRRAGPSVGAGHLPQNDPVCPAVPASRPVGTVGNVGAVARDPIGAAEAYQIGEAAKAAAAARFPNLSGWNDARDAYRHFYWSYGMTRVLGPAAAAFFGNAHEANYSGNPPREQAMDTWNNSVARAMAVDPRYKGMSTADVAEIAMSNGCLRKLR